MALLADLTAAFAAGLLALLGAWWCARTPLVPARPSEEVARAVGDKVRQHTGLRRLVVARLDRSVATGLLLTLALASTFVGILVLGVLALLVRRVAFIQHVDNSVAAWGHDHDSAWSTSGLKAVTQLGSIEVVIGLAVVLLVLDAIRRRSRWSFLFLITVMAGTEVGMLAVKSVVGRARPTLNPDAAALGPSFPSGHSATAAAFYAAAALIIGQTLPRPARRFVIAVAVGIAVAVAGSRVLLDLHWLSDVFGGLSLGWAWFALCAVVFGGRLLVPTAAADVAAAQAGSRDGSRTAARRSHQRSRAA